MIQRDRGLPSELPTRHQLPNGLGIVKQRGTVRPGHCQVQLRGVQKLILAEILYQAFQLNGAGSGVLRLIQIKPQRRCRGIAP